MRDYIGYRQLCYNAMLALYHDACILRISIASVYPRSHSFRTPRSSTGVLHLLLTSLHTIPDACTTSSSSKVPRLFLQECTYSTQISLVPEEVCLLRAFTPELDGIREGVNSLAMTADEAAAEINVLEVVFLRLQVGDLADVVAVKWLAGCIWV